MEYRSVKIRETEIGAGYPRICVPLVAADERELESSLEQLQHSPWDLVEWRTDFYENVEREAVCRKALELIRSKIGQKPLLFTFRTAAEGGNRSVSDQDYANLNEMAAASGLVDLIDVEVFRGGELTRYLVSAIHEKGVLTLGSNHDFHKTPRASEITARLCRMQELGLDITKIAVMPGNRQDVLELLQASVQMEEQYADRPFVTMSMGKTGVISRLTGSFTGSAITFGTVGKASAPGQIPAEKLDILLQILSETIG